MSIAWAILKNLHDDIKAKTLFATHYHELIDKSKSLK
jgi:DNA mismatch repair protein MutS